MKKLSFNTNMWKRFFSVVLITGLILVRLLFEIVYNDTEVDKLVQLAGSANIASGQGNSYSVYSMDQLELYNYEIVGYAPLYNYVLAALYPHLWNGAIFLDILAAVLLAASLLSIFSKVAHKVSHVHIYVVFMMVSFSPYYHLTSTDLWVTMIFIVSTLLFVKYPEHMLKGFILPGVLLGLAAQIKFSFLPFLLALPAATGIYTYFRSRSVVWNSGFMLGAGFTIFFAIKGLLPVEQKEKMMEFGFYLFQLERVDHFPWQALFFLDSLARAATETFDSFNLGYRIVALLVSIGLIILLALKVIEATLTKQFTGRVPTENQLKVLIVTVVSAVAVSGFLGILTILIPGENWQQPYWTFVEETRYYGPIIALFPIAVYILSITTSKKLINLALRALIIISIVVNGVYFAREAYRLSTGKLAYTSIPEQQTLNHIASAIEEDILNQQDQKLNIFVSKSGRQGLKVSALTPELDGVTGELNDFKSKLRLGLIPDDVRFYTLMDRGSVDSLQEMGIDYKQLTIVNEQILFRFQ